MLSFWGFLILLFLICFFCYFTILISVDYQRVMSNQQDFKKKIMISIKKVSTSYQVDTLDGNIAPNLL